MKHYGTGLIAMAFLLFACRDNKQQTTETTKTEKQEKTRFFPVADYLRSEIRYVDSLPLGIVKYSIVNGHTDSVYIKSAEFDQLAKEFLPASLEEPAFGKAFNETSFLDQTTQSATFTYSRKDKAPGLQRVDVLASPDPGYDKVKSIYLEQSIMNKDTSITKKMYWKAGKSFQIISIVQPSGQPAISSQLKVVWDNSE